MKKLFAALLVLILLFSVMPVSMAVRPEQLGGVWTCEFEMDADGKLLIVAVIDNRGTAEVTQYRSYLSKAPEKETSVFKLILDPDIANRILAVTTDGTYSIGFWSFLEDGSISLGSGLKLTKLR